MTKTPQDARQATKMKTENVLGFNDQCMLVIHI